jgi:DNA-binding MarR family transcriptional regulator
MSELNARRSVHRAGEGREESTMESMAERRIVGTGTGISTGASTVAGAGTGTGTGVGTGISMTRGTVTATGAAKATHAEQRLRAEQDPRLPLVHRLRAVSVAFQAAVTDFAAANGLHTTDVRALIELLDADREGKVATPGWLGGRLGMNSAAVTALVDRLERSGHVRRRRDPDDRRRVLLAVSEEAVEIGWAFFGPLIGRLLTAMDASCDERELAAAEHFLSRMQEAIESGYPVGPRSGGV